MDEVALISRIEKLEARLAQLEGETCAPTLEEAVEALAAGDSSKLDLYMKAGGVIPNT